MSAKSQVERLLAEAGVTLNGPHPYDLQVQNPAFYQKFLAKGTLGFGESYPDGDWTCLQPDWLISRLLSARLDERIRLRPVLLWGSLRAKYWNLQNRKRAHQVALEHYDLS